MSPYLSGGSPTLSALTTISSYGINASNGNPFFSVKFVINSFSSGSLTRFPTISTFSIPAWWANPESFLAISNDFRLESNNFFEVP